MFELLLMAQVATSDYVCWADMGYGVMDLTYLCQDSASSDTTGQAGNRANELDYLDYYQSSSRAELAGRDPLADGYTYCEMRETMTEDELARWQLDQADGVNAQEAGRVREHWLTVAVGTSLYLCP